MAGIIKAILHKSNLSKYVINTPTKNAPNVWLEDHKVHLVALSLGENQYTNPLATGGNPMDWNTPFKPHAKAAKPINGIAMCILESQLWNCGRKGKAKLIREEQNRPKAITDLILHLSAMTPLKNLPTP